MNVAGDALTFGVQGALQLQPFQATARTAPFQGQNRAGHAGQQG
jgi:hypothetical protein